MTISKIALDICAMILSKNALDAILQTRFFQRMRFRLLKNNIEKMGATKKGELGHSMSKKLAEMRGNTNIIEEVTLATDAGSTRIDIIGRTRTGCLELVEAKFGPKAALNSNQPAAFPRLAAEGGIVKSITFQKELPPLTIIPPTIVRIDWWC